MCEKVSKICRKSYIVNREDFQNDRSNVQDADREVVEFESTIDTSIDGPPG